VWAANGEFTDRDIDEAKLSVFSQVTPIVLASLFTYLNDSDSIGC